MKTPQPVRLTLSGAAREFSVDREQVRRGLIETKAMPDAAGKFSLLELARAIYGDLHRQKLMKITAERRIAESTAAQRERALLPVRDVERAWSFCVLTARSRWMQLPPKIELAYPTWTDAKAAAAWVEAAVRALLTEFATSPDYSCPDETAEEPAPRHD